MLGLWARGEGKPAGTGACQTNSKNPLMVRLLHEPDLDSLHEELRFKALAKKWDCQVETERDE